MLNLDERIKLIEAEIKSFVESSTSTAAAEEFRLKFLSKKGAVSALFDEFRNAGPEEKKQYGKALNQLKQLAEAFYKEKSASEQNSAAIPAGQPDLSLPVPPDPTGNLHPLNLIKYRIIEIFEQLGFNVEDGPEVEDDWHNFSALNFPENHPAREMQDTFFVEKNPDILLRTHTSNVQIRLMEKQKPPVRSIMPGRVYRNEAISARAHCFFHQVEGLYVDKKVSFADLKQTLYHFARKMFGPDTKIRFRPSFFPFTEPSAEIDISCLICKGKGCNVCKHSGWVEIAGSGMVHPNVLKNSGVDPEQFTGFAFGMGIERITMLCFGVNDLRLFSENDVRFLRQFRSVF
ncbi:MAG: phenylalanine--tRNA ligase subunit alpha [Bacteroidetes bacterium]|nr:phenylalanine--tRNA ligase subunit alpha [Bacteroidota bacterium]